MVEYSDIPFDTIVVCPKCGARNMRTDRLCRSCENDLAEAKRAIIGELGPPKTVKPKVLASFEEEVLIRLGRIESKAMENQGFLIMALFLIVIVLVVLIFTL